MFKILKFTSLALLTVCISVYSSDHKKAFITGITGQDGSYLAELLLEKGYEVHGLIRRSSLPNLDRLKDLNVQTEYSSVATRGRSKSIFVHYGDVSDPNNIIRLLAEIKPDEIYNLAAQSDVKVSFDVPGNTAHADALGAMVILDAIRILGLKSRFYQASTSEMFGKVQEVPQSEKTPFYPRSPYGVAKLYAHWMTINYREAYGIFACSGILFNHESPRRGINFVTRKITKTVARVKHGFESILYLGNLDSKRDWGHAKDYVEAMWLMLQQEKPDDYVVASGHYHSVREFVEKAFAEIGIEISWRGSGVQEEGYDKKTGTVLVLVDPKYFRPTEVEELLGNPTKACKILGWQPKTSFEELVKLMMQSDLEEVEKEINTITRCARR